MGTQGGWGKVWDRKVETVMSPKCVVSEPENNDLEERLMREVLLDAYHEAVPEASVRGNTLVAALARRLVAKGGRILIGPRPAARYQMVHQSLDKELRVVWADKHWKEQLGYPRHEGIGRNFLDLLAPGSRSFYKDTIWPALMADRKVGPVVIHLMDRSGVMISASYKGETLLDSDGAFERTFDRIRVLVPGTGE